MPDLSGWEQACDLTINPHQDPKLPAAASNSEGENPATCRGFTPGTLVKVVITGSFYVGIAKRAGWNPWLQDGRNRWVYDPNKKQIYINDDGQTAFGAVKDIPKRYHPDRVSIYINGLSELTGLRLENQYCTPDQYMPVIGGTYVYPLQVPASGEISVEFRDNNYGDNKPNPYGDHPPTIRIYSPAG